ncbi:UNVERIFIED_CONTAM: hypothetical protein PYX00_001323 [Menopon gallinae]|uniref:Uncharacterized protein n=1 Tax=Menopon gallinae TaxID=328185 RepID=A0AAW2IEE5_9NEOP
MPVTGPAGILAFYILSACGYSGLFYRHKSSFDVAECIAIPTCSILAFILIRCMCRYLSKAKPLLPAEQIVMDVKKMNINFTLIGPDNKHANG